jgi:hypothetical protein
MNLLLLIVLLLLLFGGLGLPQVSGTWHNMGYGPSGLVLIVLLVLVVLLLVGRL